MLLARALRPRHAVVVHPQFTEPEAALRAAGHAVERVLLDGGPSGSTRRAVPASADLVVVGNPTNPTSVLHPAASLAALARPGRTLVVDEAFIDTAPGEPDSLAGRRDLPGLVVLRSLTKTWGLAGLRVGYALAPARPGRRPARAPPRRGRCRRRRWWRSRPAAPTRARAEADAAARALAADREHLVAALAGARGRRGPRHARRRASCWSAPRARTDVRRAPARARPRRPPRRHVPRSRPEHVRIAVRSRDDHRRPRRRARGGPGVSALEPGDRDALHRVLRARRDVRTGFVDTPVDDERLHRVLAAAHAAPSVGFSQPWDFLVLRSPALRDELAALAAGSSAGRSRRPCPPPARGRSPACGWRRSARRRWASSSPATRPAAAATSSAGTPSRGWPRTRWPARCRTCGSPRAPRASASAGSASSTSASWPRCWASASGCPSTSRSSPTCASATSRRFADEPELATAGWARRRPLAWAVHDETWGNHHVDPLDETLAALADLDPSRGRGRGPRAPDADDRAARRARRGRRARRAPGRARRAPARRRCPSRPSSRSSPATTGCTPAG